MRMPIALLLTAALAAIPFTGEAGEKRITDVKELAGTCGVRSRRRRVDKTA